MARRATFDFSDVKTASRKKIPSGDYKFRIEEIEDGEGDAGPYWKVISTISEGKHEGFKDWSNYSHSKKALWKLAQLLTACGIKVSKKKMTVDKKSLIGCEFGATVEDDTYEGKTRSKIADVFPVDELEETDEEEDEEDEENDEDEDEEDDEEVDDEDKEDEDEEEDEEDEEEEETTKKKSKTKKK